MMTPMADNISSAHVRTTSSTRKGELPAVAILSLPLVLFAACGTSGAKGSDASVGLDVPSSGGAGEAAAPAD